MIKIEKEYQLLKDLSFTRVSTTKEEEKAADLIIARLKAEGLDAYKEEFEVDSFDSVSSQIEVIEPFHKTYDVITYANSGSTGEDGLTGELYYYESDNEVNLKDVKGKIVLVNGMMRRDSYKKIVKAGAIGFVSFNGNVDIEYDKTDIAIKELREPLREAGVIPGVNMRVHDVLEMVNSGATKVKFNINQPLTKAVSHNVICDIKGSEDTKETIVFTAHYDSVPYSTGAYDNATGSVSLYAMAMYFKEHQPKRNLRFIFCGSEERGLLGSKAYCKSHNEELENIVMCINIDMIGSILGKRIAVATADEKLVTYTEYFANMTGFPIEASQGVYSSDSTPFADCGIPAISFARITPQGGGSIHSRFDSMDILNEHFLEEDTEFITRYAEAFANAYVFPVKKEMPDKMKEELDKYLGREKEDKKELKEK